jgi:hypothetical protein
MDDKREPRFLPIATDLTGDHLDPDHMKQLGLSDDVIRQAYPGWQPKRTLDVYRDAAGEVNKAAAGEVTAAFIALAIVAIVAGVCFGMGWLP